MDPTKLNSMPAYNDHEAKNPLVKTVSENDSFLNEPANPYSGATPMRSFTPAQRPYTPESGFNRPFTANSHRTLNSMDSRENLVRGAATLGGVDGSPPPPMPRQYANGAGGYRGVAY